MWGRVSFTLVENTVSGSMTTVVCSDEILDRRIDLALQNVIVWSLHTPVFLVVTKTC